MGDTSIIYSDKFGINTFKSEICVALGEDFWNELVEGIDLLDIDNEWKCQCRNMQVFMKRLEEKADAEMVKHILYKVRHGLHPSQSAWAREKFLAVGDLACEYEITLPDDIMEEYVVKKKSEKIASNYYRYYKSFAESGIIDCHEETVSWIMPKEREKGPSLGYGVFLHEETAEAEIKKLTEKICNKQAPQNWIITPDCAPGNLIEILERNGFQNMATDDSDPEPAMLLEKNEFQPYSTSEDSIVCRKVQTKEDFRSWIEVVNIALHGWEMIDADNYYAWVENENFDLYLGEIDGISVSTAATIRNGDTASLEFVSTLEEHRRKKVASVVCSTALTNLFESGVEDVTLSACGESVYLYEKFGFKAYFNNIIMSYDI